MENRGLSLLIHSPAGYEPTLERTFTATIGISFSVPRNLASFRCQQYLPPPNPMKRMNRSQGGVEGLQLTVINASTSTSLSLDLELNQRSWTTGILMNPGRIQYFREDRIP